MLKVCTTCQTPYVRPRSGDVGRCGPCARHHRASQPSTTEKGLGSTWARAAREQIAREPVCAWCGSTTDLTADHIVPRKYGGTIADGLKTLCRPCNSSRGAGPRPAHARSQQPNQRKDQQ